MGSPKKKMSRSFAAMHNERNTKMSHFRFPMPNKNSEAFSTMDSASQPKCVISLNELRYVIIGLTLLAEKNILTDRVKM